MIEDLVEPLFFPDEDKIFTKAYDSEWKEIMKQFRYQAKEIEDALDSFMQNCFSKLRSSEDALEMVQTIIQHENREDDQLMGIESVHTTTSPMKSGLDLTVNQDFVKQQISECYHDILSQYAKELDALKKSFILHQDNPHLFKNYPPIAGSIAWARSLYQKAKRPILKFKNNNGILADPSWETIKANYLTFARSVDNYITDLYNDWETKTNLLVTEKLKQSLLKSINIKVTVPTMSQKIPLPISDADYKNVAISTNSLASRMSKKDQKQPYPVIPPPPYRADFAEELHMIIKESKYLDKLGFKVPEVIRF
jgi:dynein heavy chain